MAYQDTMRNIYATAHTQTPDSRPLLPGAITEADAIELAERAGWEVNE
jgi:hypothetical protein